MAIAPEDMLEQLNKLAASVMGVRDAPEPVVALCCRVLGSTLATRDRKLAGAGDATNSLPDPRTRSKAFSRILRVPPDKIPDPGSTRSCAQK